jgi:hypothetical protein
LALRRVFSRFLRKSNESALRICAGYFFILASQMTLRDRRLILYIVALARATNFPTRPEPDPKKVSENPGQFNLQHKNQ